MARAGIPKPVDLESKVADGQVDLGTGDPASLSLPVEWGRYRLTLGDSTSVEFRAGWASAGSLDTPDGLELALDKPSYKAGETAKLKVTPRFAGKLLLAIGTDRIRKTLSVDVPAEGTTLDIPVEEDWGAGAYLLANLYRPSDKGTSRNPMRAIGVEWLGVSPEERALSIRMEAPETIRPREHMEVPVKVDGLKAGEEAYVTIALVDEGILNLTGYKNTRSCWSLFRPAASGAWIFVIFMAALSMVRMAPSEPCAPAVTAAGHRWMPAARCQHRSWLPSFRALCALMPMARPRSPSIFRSSTARPA